MGFFKFMSELQSWCGLNLQVFFVIEAVVLNRRTGAGSKKYTQLSNFSQTVIWLAIVWLLPEDDSGGVFITCRDIYLPWDGGSYS